MNFLKSNFMILHDNLLKTIEDDKILRIEFWRYVENITYTSFFLQKISKKIQNSHQREFNVGMSHVQNL